MNHINISLLYIALIFLASCKKHHSCECITNGEIVGTPYSDTEIKTTPKMTSSEAKTWCETDNNTYSDGYNTNYNVKCKIK